MLLLTKLERSRNILEVKERRHTKKSEASILLVLLIRPLNRIVRFVARGIVDVLFPSGGGYDHESDISDLLLPLFPVSFRFVTASYLFFTRHLLISSEVCKYKYFISRNFII